MATPPEGLWPTLREINRQSGTSPAEKYLAIMLCTFIVTGKRMPGYRLLPPEFRSLIDQARAAWQEGGTDGLAGLTFAPIDATDGPADRD